MEQIFQTIETRLHRSGIVEKGTPLLGFAEDTRMSWNRQSHDIGLFEKILGHLPKKSAKSLLFSMPGELYGDIIRYLAETSGEKILPRDCETRNFLTDLPVSSELTPDAIIPILTRRKCVIVPERGIVTISEGSPEDAYVTFSSVCFACFVKFFSDFLYDAKHGTINKNQQLVFERAVSFLKPLPKATCSLMSGPFETEKDIFAAMEQAGSLTVRYGLVDSCFGNISYCHNHTLYISQTRSFLDNLDGYIVSCSLNDIPCRNASSELPAHRRIAVENRVNAILHGHPLFAVILSMDCDRDACEHRDACHLKCSQERFACDIPIVPGEIGGGDYGLCNTVPPAVRENPGVIVYGHGLFTTGRTDFNEPFGNLLKIETNCREEYFRRVSP